MKRVAERHLFAMAVAAVSLMAESACTSMGRDVSEDLDLSIADGIRGQLLSQRLAGPAASAMTSISQSAVVEDRRPFGRGEHAEAQLRFETRNDGLTSIITSTRSTPLNSVVTARSTTVSLCGLVTVVSELDATVIAQASTGIISAGGAIPIGVNGANVQSVRTRLTSLTTNFFDLCEPRPSSSFAYDIEFESQRKIDGGMVKSNKQQSVTEHATCTVDEHSTAASALEASLSGDFLGVSCRVTGSPSGDRSVRLAYLMDSHMYLPIAIDGDQVKTRFDYSMPHF